MTVSLRTKILLLVAATISVLAALVFVSLGLLANREIATVVRSDVRATGAVLGQLIAERSQTLTEECRMIANLPIFKAVVQTGDPSTITDSVRDSIGQIHADAAMMTDSRGRLMGVTDNAAPIRSDCSGDPGVSAALQGNAWSGITMRRGQLVQAVSVPIRIGEYVQGTFSAYRRIDSNVAMQLHHELGTDVAFVADGNVVGSSLPLPGQISTRTGSFATMESNGTSYLGHYSPFPNTTNQEQLGFVTLKSASLAAAPYNRLKWVFVAIFVLSSLLTLTVGTIVARGLIAPLDGVVQAADTLRKGEWPARFQDSRNDEIGLLQTVFNDMTTAMRESQDKLLGLIDSDPLTGLWNHRRFQERLAEEAERCAASGERLTMMRVNIDHFQTYNQRFGHATGDDALRQIAEMLKGSQPSFAIISRFAGDEFVVLLPQQTLDQAYERAESLRRAIYETWYVKAGPSKNSLSVSVGLAEFGVHTKQADGLLLAAELALSRAKHLGRNLVCAFDTIPGADETADPYQLYRFMKDESLATIQALAAAVDAKDPYTRGHSQHVAEYASRLAEYLGLTKAEIDSIHTCGTLHDVGKIGVPDAVLKKPGRLTDEERAIMETHPVLGELIVTKVPSLAAIVPGVKHHHERWDGTGYPNKLAGESIPKIARILALADSFDAMTSDRPYRKGLPFSQAVQQIELGAGTQFDPELAHAFLKLLLAQRPMAKAA